MKKLLFVLMLTGCAPLYPKPVSPTQLRCAEMATNDSMSYFVFIGPVTGNIVRAKLYKDCVQ